jgi:hypothetical protein
MGSRGFEVNLQTRLMQHLGEWLKIMHEGFSPGNHHKLGMGRIRLSHKIGEWPLGMMLGTPTDLGIAPGTPHITPGQADEEGIAARPVAFPLD